MGNTTRVIGMSVLVTVCIGIWLFVPCTVGAHCDTLDGPVVKTAKMALEKGDVTPVLKWVKKEYEGEIREAFKKTLSVREKGKEAKERCRCIQILSKKRESRRRLSHSGKGD